MHLPSIRILTTISIVLVLSSAMQSQNYFNQDTEWLTFAFDGLGNGRSFALVTFQEERIIKNKLCLVYQSNNYRVNLANDTIYSTNKDVLLLHEDHDKVYIFEEDTFRLIYDYGLEVGDTMSVLMNCFGADSILHFELDSIAQFSHDEHSPFIHYFSTSDLKQDLHPFGVLDSVIQVVPGMGIFTRGNFSIDPFYFSYCSTDPPDLSLLCFDNGVFSFEQTIKVWSFDYSCQENLKILPINNIDNPLPILIFPNPGSDLLFVTLPREVDVKEIGVYNSSGSRVLSQYALPIQITNLISGAYLLRIITNRGILSKRFLKM